MWSKAMGWGETSWPNGTDSYEFVVLGWKSGVTKTALKSSGWVPRWCAGGIAGKDSCSDDTGSPLIKEKGDAGDVLIGLGKRLRQDGYPAIYSRVSAAVE
ncbi:hypothetical protein V7S43_010335 [Phytophthora oleae]|uniref:Peptidase S1 domain-containing protein n=1 Tax=Phytophthora oleae TaxID=2107226 RepID=A0ABD3FGD3_9STRA